MERENNINIEELNKKLKKHIWLQRAYSFLNDQKRAKANREILLELENKIIMAKLKKAK